MKKADLEKLEGIVLEELVKRRQLGGYNADAAGLILLTDAMRHLIRHIIDNAPDDHPSKKK